MARNFCVSYLSDRSGLFRGIRSSQKLQRGTGVHEHLETLLIPLLASYRLENAVPRASDSHVGDGTEGFVRAAGTVQPNRWPLTGPWGSGPYGPRNSSCDLFPNITELHCRSTSSQRSEPHRVGKFGEGKEMVPTHSLSASGNRDSCRTRGCPGV